uniref:Uncharacterized protein n=1 Tax=Cairina moschata TaxID=8855 RepID=A0A8C3GPU1_CAIMO
MLLQRHDFHQPGFRRMFCPAGGTPAPPSHTGQPPAGFRPTPLLTMPRAVGFQRRRIILAGSGTASFLCLLLIKTHLKGVKSSMLPP